MGLLQTPEGDCVKQVVLTIATGIAAPDQRKVEAEDQWRMTTGTGRSYNLPSGEMCLCCHLPVALQLLNSPGEVHGWIHVLWGCV